MNDLIKRLEARKAELVAQSQKSEDIAELRAINKQLATLDDDIKAAKAAQEKFDAGKDEEDEDERTKAFREYEARKAKEAAEKRAEQPPQYVPGKGFIPAEERGVDKSLNLALELREKAGESLKSKKEVKSPLSTFGELRTVTVTPATGATATIVVPSAFSPTINPDFPVVSALVDAVSHLSMNGGESYRQAYITGIDTGDYTAEGADAAEAETHFDYVDINRTKITAYAELTEELQKLPAAPYADVVVQNIRTSMRKLLTREILVGAGGNNQIVGIFSDKAKAIDAATDYGISQITDTTLDEILFNYGGDEEVEDPAVLILSKLDLLAFTKVRTATKQKFYDIQLRGNGGYINGIPFIINSACKTLSTADGAAEGDYCMAYGSLSNYQLTEFSPMEVKQSDDYRFRKGMTAFRGDCFFGGNVIRKNGFLRIVKKS